MGQAVRGRPLAGEEQVRKLATHGRYWGKAGDIMGVCEIDAALNPQYQCHGGKAAAATG